MDEPYSVLDKWLNRLDLSDDPLTQRQQQPSATGTTPPPPLVHSPATPSSATTTSTNFTSLHLPPAGYCASTKSPTRVSTDSLDSLPSETTLSSSAGSRAYMSTNHSALFAPIGNNGVSSSSSSSKMVNKAPAAAFNKRHSNPITFVSRSLSNLKNEHTKVQKQHCHQSPPLSFDSMTLSSASERKTPFLRKEWEMEDLFHFDDDLLPSKLYKTGETHTPPLSHGF